MGVSKALAKAVSDEYDLNLERKNSIELHSTTEMSPILEVWIFQLKQYKCFWIHEFILDISQKKKQTENALWRLKVLKYTGKDKKQKTF